jgi:lysine-N-methylase
MLSSLRPHYGKEFRCIGADCEDTCCQGWEVLIDQDSYSRLRGIHELRDIVAQHLVVISNSKNEYARIELTASQTCPFLSAERLCRIHGEHGEHNLPEICAAYPRAARTIDGLRETSLMLACPEAARLVLLNPALVEPEEGSGPRYGRFARLAPVRPNGSPHQFLWDVRAFALLLVRDREYPLWQRLLLLGIFCRRMRELAEAGETGLVPELLRQHSMIIAEGGLRATLNGVPLRTGAQLATLLGIINRHLGTTAGTNPRFRECVRDFLAGVGCAEGAAIENCAPRFEQNNLLFCAPFLDSHPYLLENYLVNHIFRTRFPYGLDIPGHPSDPLSEFLMLCILYSLIQTLLVGASGVARESFGAGHVVKVVQSVAKAVEQCPKFPWSDYRALADAGGIALLLQSNA